MVPSFLPFLLVVSSAKECAVVSKSFTLIQQIAGTWDKTATIKRNTSRGLNLALR